ncbi:GlxA family transcriptional regulator [Marinivivus vitaminiproducens]|uniref:GlxA family transcriptional regulator n=1 Tax=Marinivivus vitaminiproducens TaxID=3035935 RepID=UPI0027A96E1D|nr:GlxA family transcriptional regulator [Geminicoccaceae bacterium SCSIO 64248]
MSERRSDRPESIGFVLVPGFTLLAFAAVVETLRLANYVSGRELYRWLLLSGDGTPVLSSAGFLQPVDGALATAAAPATVIVCSGRDGHRFDDPKITAWLRRAAAQGAVVGSVCTGSHVLARAGLLNGYRCTIHWENLAGFSETFPEIEATGDLFTVDRNRFTCAGGTAGADMMLQRIARTHGDKLAIDVAEEMLHDTIRAGSDRQPRAKPAHSIERRELSAAIALMSAHIEEPLDLHSLAGRLGQSRRNIERLFRSHLSVSPARYYLDMRLKRARQLLLQTNMSVMEVAISCGFVSATHFSKCYRDRYGVPPRRDQSSHRRGPLAVAALGERLVSAD